jgi:hypothetical protein
VAAAKAVAARAAVATTEAAAPARHLAAEEAAAAALVAPTTVHHEEGRSIASYRACWSLEVQLPFPADHPPSCTIKLHPIVTTQISTGRASRAQFERCAG